MKRPIAATLTLGVALALSPVAGADPTPPTTLSMTAAPIFGNDAALGFGWEEVVVTLANSGTTARKGTLDLTASLQWNQAENFVTRAPFNVPAGRTAVVRVPTHGIADQVEQAIQAELPGADVTVHAEPAGRG